MKKGGVSEVNSFISVGPTEWTRDSVIKKPGTISTLSKTRSSTTNASNAAKIKKPSSLQKTGTDRSKPLKSSPSIKSSVTGQIKKIEDKSINIFKSNAKPPALPNSSAKISFRSSIEEEKRAISSHKTTMQDVYKRKLQDVPIPKTEKKITKTVSDTQITNVVRSTNNTTGSLISPENEATNVMKDTKDEDCDYCDYEDDFEDYESTFESYSGSESNDSLHQDLEISANNNSEDQKIIIEEEKKMDSGSYDLMSRKQIQRERNQLDIIREALQKENTLLNNSDTNSKDGFHLADQYLLSTNMNHFRTDELLLNFNDKSMQNFSNARIEQRNSKTARMIRIRGEKLMEMITLDTMNYVLYEQPTVPYDIFMRSFASQNTKQVYTQTNEDSSSSKIQTEEITNQSKWTQYPVKIRSNELNNNNLAQLLAGAGNENSDLEDANDVPEIHTRNLNNFINTYGEEMIAVLEENLHETELENTYNTEATATKISSYISRIKYNSIPILRGRPVVLLHYDPYNPTRLLTVHRKENAKREGHCLVSVWNIYQPWKPKIVLKSHGNISSACFVSRDSSYVVAGHEDGSLCVWNLSENNSYCMMESVDDNEEMSFMIKFPSYNTAEVLKNANHRSKVVQIDSVQAIETSSAERKPEMIYSIEEENTLIIWTLSTYTSQTFDVGSAPWSKTKFFINQTINITQLLPKDIFQTTLMKVLTESQILLGTNAGYALKFSLYNNKLKEYKTFSASHDSNDIKTKVTSLEICPYNRLYFAVAYATGDISLFHTNYSEPVCEIRRDNFSFILAPVVVQWLWSDRNYVLALDSRMRLRTYRFRSTNYVSEFLHDEEPREKIESMVVSPFLPNQRVLNFALLTRSEIQIHKSAPLNKSKVTNPNIW